MFDITKIKLVIWDLDDTFWKGTLSEGPITTIPENIKLVKDLTERGIVNTICSKNDYKPTVTTLKELGVNEYFVFKSIDWTPKGQRISQLIKDMGLRPVNCLFIDDNIVNLKEAKFYSEDLMVADPSEIVNLVEFCENTMVSDIVHKRLNQYRILEKKQKAKLEAKDNLQFLYASNTKVEIHYDCESHVDRILELINRTNQLNYTKKRCTKEEFYSLLDTKETRCGYVTVTDNFGDYGIVGFYALRNSCLEHFLFSCRTIGQGVEQYVYAILGHPKLNVIGEVVTAVTHDPAPVWINQKESRDQCQEDTQIHGKAKKILIKGACDLDIMASFLSSPSIVTEFAYIGEKHNRIEHHNHSVNILQFHTMNTDEQTYILDNLPFNDTNMFNTNLFDDDVAIVFLSTQIEPNLGVYKSKKYGLRIAFGEWCYPLTDPKNWDGYMNDTIPNYGNRFTKEWLTQFANEWEFEGQITLDEYEENIRKLLTLIHKDAKICLLLGSELPYEANTQKAYENRHLIYRSYNERFRKLAEEEPRILTLDFSKLIHRQEDFLDNINHYQRRIYYEASQEARGIIQNVIGQSVDQKSVFSLWLDEIAAWSRSHLNRESKAFGYLKYLYRRLRK